MNLLIKSQIRGQKHRGEKTEDWRIPIIRGLEKVPTMKRVEGRGIICVEYGVFLYYVTLLHLLSNQTRSWLPLLWGKENYD